MAPRPRRVNLARNTARGLNPRRTAGKRVKLKRLKALPCPGRYNVVCDISGDRLLPQVQSVKSVTSVKSVI
ncbi:MAG: hypothetical protein ACMG55_06230 [Microcoleus sp.]